MSYDFIIYKDNYYVPRLPSLCEARERNDIFKQQFDVEPLIVNDFEWHYLCGKSNIINLEVKRV